MIRSTSVPFVFIAVVLGSSPAIAQTESPKESGFEVGARVGYGLPMGKIADGDIPAMSGDMNLAELYTANVPLWFDAGYRVNRHLYVGGFFQYGLGVMKDRGLDASGSITRFGVDAQYHLLPGRVLDPWIGLGMGYEIATVSWQGTPTARSRMSLRGFELVNVQAGADYAFAPGLAIGPFAAFSIGRFTHESLEVGGTADRNTIEQPALHEWLTLGVRGSFVL